MCAWCCCISCVGWFQEHVAEGNAQWPLLCVSVRRSLMYDLLALKGITDTLTSLRLIADEASRDGGLRTSKSSMDFQDVALDTRFEDIDDQWATHLYPVPVEMVTAIHHNLGKLFTGLGFATGEGGPVVRYLRNGDLGVAASRACEAARGNVSELDARTLFAAFLTLRRFPLHSDMRCVLVGVRGGGWCSCALSCP